jgi:acyl-CoA thioester hydrolase
MILTKIQVRFNDMDPMQRVNNSVYSSYLELGRLDFCNRYLEIKELNDIPLSDKSKGNYFKGFSQVLRG